MKSLKIKDRLIGNGNPVFVIAEGGVNHNQDLNIALDLVKKAKESGAEAIKFQTFKAERLVSIKAESVAHQGEGESQLEIIRKLELTEELHREIKKYADELGILFFSSPLSIEDAIFLEELGVDFYKVASCMLTDHKLIDFLAKTKKPMIVSTGMASIDEIAETVEIIKNHHDNFALLHCISLYPPDDSLVNLKTIELLKTVFEVSAGYSDHCLHPYACYGAVALGADIIEKHFTLDKNLPGPDHTISADPKELKEIVEGVRAIEKLKGKPVCFPGEAEKQMRENFGISIVAKKDIKKGEQFNDENTCVMRPGKGLAPKYIDWIKTRDAIKDISRGEPITRDCV